MRPFLLRPFPQNPAPDSPKLAYSDIGAGSPALLLLHGASCDHTFMVYQARYFSAKHRIILVDLPGHGKDAAAPSAFDFFESVNLLAELIGHLGIRDLLIIGHSLGGLLGLQLAIRLPHLVSGLVALDSTFSRGKSRRSSASEAGMYTNSYGGYLACEPVPGDSFYSFRETYLRTRGDLSRFTPGNPDLAAIPEVPASYDYAEALRINRSPILYIGASHPRTDLQELESLRRGVITAKAALAGHFLQLEVPEQVNGMIARFMSAVVKPFMDKREK